MPAPGPCDGLFSLVAVRVYEKKLMAPEPLQASSRDREHRNLESKQGCVILKRLFIVGSIKMENLAFTDNYLI